MGFKGDLNTFNLANIFQTLAMSRQTGTLAIFNSKEACEGYIYFEQGLIKQAATSGSRKTLFGELLLRKGIIAQSDLEKALAYQRTTQERLGDILQKMGTIKREQIEDTLRFQQEEMLYEMFSWDNALFEFTDDQRLDGVFDEEIRAYNVSFNTNSVLMEAMRRLDEWGRIRNYIPTENEVPILLVHPAALTDPVEVELGPLINGVNSIKKICTVATTGKFATSQVLAEMIKNGAIRLKEAHELVQTGNDCLASGFFEEAIAVFSLVQSKEAWDADVAANLVKAYREVGNTEKAVECLREIVQHFSEGEHPAESIPFQQEIVSLLPNAIAERVKLGELYAFAKLRNKAIEELRTAIRRINTKESPALYIDAAEKLIALWPDEVRIREELIDVLLRQQAKDKALEMLGSLAVLHAGQGNYKAAIDVYHRMVSIAPEKEDFRHKLEQLVDLEGKRRARRLRMARLSVFAVIVLCIVGFMLGYIIQIRSIYLTYENDAEGFAVKGKYGEALNQVQSFISEYPFASLFLRRAQERVQYYTEEWAKQNNAAAEEMKARRTAETDRAIAFSSSIPADSSQIAVEDLLAKAYEMRSTVQFDDGRKIIDEQIRRLEQIRDIIDGRISDVDTAVKQNEIAKAHDLAIELHKSFPASKKAAGVKIPIKIDCRLPLEAQVTCNGTPAGNSPIVVFADYGTDVEISIKAQGFASHVERFDPSTKSEIICMLERAPTWSIDVASRNAVVTRPSVAGDSVIFVSRSGEINAFSTEKTERVFSTSIEALTKNSTDPHDVVANSVFADGILYIPSLDGNLYAFDVKARKINWQFPTKDFLKAEPLIGVMGAMPVIWFGSDGGVLYCVSLRDGKEVWRFPASGPIVSKPVQEGQYLYITCRDRNMYKLDRSNGKLVSKTGTSAPISASPVIFGGHVCFGNDAGDFYVVNPSSMAILQCISLGQMKVIGAPIPYDRFLVLAATSLGTDDVEPGRIVVLDTANWQIVSSVAFSGRISASPVLFKNEIYCASSTGTISCYRITVEGEVGFELLWQYDTGKRIIADPIVESGMIIFVTERGAALAFR
ncbi:MAG: PQQ-binding-like beta-propeller repeat protein [Candidatus Brocadiia bacterium]